MVLEAWRPDWGKYWYVSTRLAANYDQIVVAGVPVKGVFCRVGSLAPRLGKTLVRVDEFGRKIMCTAPGMFILLFIVTFCNVLEYRCPPRDEPPATYPYDVRGL